MRDLDIDLSIGSRLIVNIPIENTNMTSHLMAVVIVSITFTMSKTFTVELTSGMGQSQI